jgi:uncharacterized membrane protein
MNFENSFFTSLILVGLLFSFIAMILYIFPPKKINFLYGYRTSGSMKSQERWNFAQQYSAIAMLQSGLGLIAVSTLGLFAVFPESITPFIEFALVILSVIVLFIRTERALKKRFVE